MPAGGGGGRLEEGNQVSARRGEEYVIFYWRKIVRGICATRVFLAGNRARNGVTLSSRSKTCLPFGNLYLTISYHKKA